MRGRTMWLAGLVVLLGLATGACSKDSDDGGVASASGSSAPAASPSAGSDLTKFSQCMRDNGVDMPDPDPNTGRIDFRALRGNSDPKFQDAMNKCRSLLVAAGSIQQLTTAEIEQLRQFATCMRDNGVDLPDPDMSNGLFTAMQKQDRNSPTFRKAMETCFTKLPQSITGGGNG